MVGTVVKDGLSGKCALALEKDRRKLTCSIGGHDVSPGSANERLDRQGYRAVVK